MTEAITVTVVNTPQGVSVSGGETTTVTAQTETVSVQATGAGTTVSSTTTQVATAATIQSQIVSATTLEIVELGIPGSAGSGGNANAYTHVQSTPSAAWVAYHQLNTMPVIDIQIGGEQAYGRVSYPSLDSALIEFNTPVTGTAKCVG